MKIRLGLTAAFLFCLTATLSAADIGPLQALLTKEEAAAWKNVKTDADAQAFLDVFWAKRDPSPGTPENEYRAGIEQRIKYADEQFAEGKTRGSMTDRGRTYLVFGVPQKAARTADPNSGIGADVDARSRGDAGGAVVEWTYEGDDAKALFGMQRAVLRFADRLSNQTLKLERGNIDMNKAQQAAIARTITNPNATAAPAAVAPAPVPVPLATAPAPPPVQTELTTDAFKAAVLEGKTRGGAATWGEFVTSYGETFVPVGVYVPKSAGLTGPDVTLFGLVKDASGTSVLAFEEPLKA
ncbi:MAG TPA: GWxTD domain-containing protein, partial [Thermoanaerobaculia bacterium]|nr:GWxTD domain-containing protein [Thermoanaerobaculia bacterium]